MNCDSPSKEKSDASKLGNFFFLNLLFLALWADNIGDQCLSLTPNINDD